MKISCISRICVLTSMIFLVLNGLLFAQIEEYHIHNRGMLWETVFNTGTISRAWNYEESRTVVPLCEWPSRSATIVESIEYDGQHNNIGGGISIGVIYDGKIGKDNRIYAFCGAVGADQPEKVVGAWSFPIYLKKIDNFPIIEDINNPNWGELNPAYDPNEAEQVIEAQWATSTGITVTRASRVWSYPDYDDFVIYEYTLENTGDLDGNPATIEQDVTLNDVIVSLEFGFASSMIGYMRYYQIWKYNGGHRAGDQNAFYDHDYWLHFNLNLRTFLNDTTLWAKPEPDKERFINMAQTGENGGGLWSPQAAGSCILFYDMDHLAVIDAKDSSRNESEFVDYLKTADVADFGYQIGDYYELDENGHVKQPINVRNVDGTQQSSVKSTRGYHDPYGRVGQAFGVKLIGQYKEARPLPNDDPRWIGRAYIPINATHKASYQCTSFGPYKLRMGDKIEFSIAEVVGFGSDPHKIIFGGQRAKDQSITPDWNGPIWINGELISEHYLDDYGYPDYVNSNVRTIQQVAHKAYRAYLGSDPVVPVWPEDYNMKDGNYQIPIPPPAPAIKVRNKVDGTVSITWKNSGESFTHPNLTGAVSQYNVWISKAGMGPWTLIQSVNIGTSMNTENLYEVLDDDPDFRVGEKRFYAVTSTDAAGNESGKTNVIQLEKNIGSVDKLETVYVVPNPFKVLSGFTGSGEVADQIGFYGLPEECTIRVFSVAGQLITTIEHDNPVYSTAWLQITRSGQQLASGVYYYVVTTPDGQKSSGKFVIVK